MRPQMIFKNTLLLLMIWPLAATAQAHAIPPFN